MNKYDDKSLCPKCGCPEVYSAWHPDGADYHHAFHENSQMRGLAEHICRTCQRCHYQWPEATVAETAQ